MQMLYILKDNMRWVRGRAIKHIKVKYAHNGCLCGASAAKSGADIRAVDRVEICDLCFESASHHGEVMRES
jgi:hypothetical protein